VNGLRSGQVAEAAGVNIQTLRYYERRGLLAEPERTLGGHRLYPADAVVVLRAIKAAQRLGFTLDEVADLLEAGRHRRGKPDAGLQARAHSKLAEIDARIADLSTVRTDAQDWLLPAARELFGRAERDGPGDHGDLASSPVPARLPSPECLLPGVIRVLAHAASVGSKTGREL